MWKINYIPEAQKNLDKIYKKDKSLHKQIIAGISKVSQNPLSKLQGGYGSPLSNKNNCNLTNFFKIKYKQIGIRVTYTLVLNKKIMNICVIARREDDKVYKMTEKIKLLYGDNLFSDEFNK